MKANRTRRSPVREQRLTSSVIAADTPAIPLSVWRGRSGPSYVVRVTDIDQPELVASRGAVVIAVGRDAGGCATIIARRACDPGDPGFLGWLAACATRGATELHTHWLAETADQRRRIVDDLTDLPPVVA